MAAQWSPSRWNIAGLSPRDAAWRAKSCTRVRSVTGPILVPACGRRDCPSGAETGACIAVATDVCLTPAASPRSLGTIEYDQPSCRVGHRLSSRYRVRRSARRVDGSGHRLGGRNRVETLVDDRVDETVDPLLTKARCAPRQPLDDLVLACHIALREHGRELALLYRPDHRGAVLQQVEDGIVDGVDHVPASFDGFRYCGAGHRAQGPGGLHDPAEHLWRDCLRGVAQRRGGIRMTFDDQRVSSGCHRRYGE